MITPISGCMDVGCRVCSSAINCIFNNTYWKKMNNENEVQELPLGHIF